MKKRQGLTKGEEEIMQLLWQLGKGTVNDIIALMPDPKPKYTTVATFIKILENKEYVRHEQLGKSFVYYPAVEKEEHARSVMKSMLTDYFGGSVSNLVSFFSQHENISTREMDEILEIIDRAKKA